jgi:hypothetical protein
LIAACAATNRQSISLKTSDGKFHFGSLAVLSSVESTWAGK